MTEHKTTIFVVDGEDNERRLLERILEEAGYVVVAVANGHEALEKLPLISFDLVLMDIKISQQDCVQTITRIREQSNIPMMIVVGTNNLDPEQIRYQ